MKTFWMFMPWLPYHIGLDKLNKHCVFLNEMEMFQARPRGGQVATKKPPTAELKVTLEDFDIDCFTKIFFTLVSEQMRDAMALGPSDVQYFDVDASQSASLPQSKHYQIMHIPATEDVSDPQNSDYARQHRSDGSVVPSGIPLSVVFRADAEPTHEIFYDKFFRVIYCTEELALRVLQAGCSGVRFFDPSCSTGGNSGRFRTVRGVEQEIKWDTSRKKLSTKLIREIP